MRIQKSNSPSGARKQNFNLKFKILLFLFVLLTFNFLLFTLPTFATDTSPSSDIKTKLEEFKKEIASKAAKLKQEISLKLRDKTYVGKVKTKSDNAITLATKNGPKIVNINQDSEFNSNIKGKKYSPKLISEEDYLAALGDVDEIGVLTARKIILLPSKTSETKTFLWGQIVAISDKLATLKDKNLKNIAVSFSTPATIKVSDFIILTGSMGKNDIFTAEFVYVIPQGGILKPKKVATQSAKIASPSATPQSTSKPISH